MNFTKFFTIAALLAVSVSAQAESLSCLVGVYTANDVTDESADPSRHTQVLTLPLVDGEGDQEFQVAGETVAFMANKFEYTDLYNLTILLTTPVADRAKRGPAMVAILTEHLYNDGPTKENGWDINPGPNATRYSFLSRQVGTFALSTKAVAALKAAGKWGTHPFTSLQMDINNTVQVADFVREQVTAKTMQPTDVIGLSTMFSCTVEK